MGESIKREKLGFAANSPLQKKKSKNPSERLISWSPWPPADFQTRYPAFPFVLTILILIFLKTYFSLIS